MSSSSHHKVHVAEQKLQHESIKDDENDDPECGAFLADQGVQDGEGPPVDERDLIEVLISRK